MGGDNIQAPHFDGIGNKNSKGVSVIFAIDDGTYLCVFNEKSLKQIGDGKNSIEYRRVFVPKGRAIYFNSFICLHGGGKYEDIGNTSERLDSGRHLRIFGRWINPSTINNTIDFFLKKDVTEYICTGDWNWDDDEKGG